MDAFFAAVEQRENPDLQGKPVAVGGGGKRGVVASASYEARKYGVHSAMPGMTAARLCPGLIFVKHNFNLYKEVSQQIREIFEEYTDLVEPLSLDEAFLDVTENKKGIFSAMKIAMEIRAMIEERTQLTASAGVSFNKFLAKIASDINKPNGMKVILPEEAEAFLEALPIKKFFGIGKVTEKKMNRLGIYKGADMKELSEIELVRHFGKVGRHYYRIVRAQDNRPVNPNRIRKSIGAERTFGDNLKTLEEMKERLAYVAERVFEYMKKTENYGRTLTIKIKNPDFQVITRSKTFSREMRHRTSFFAAVDNLMEENWEEGLEARLLGVSVSNLMKELKGEGGIQLEIEFEENEE